MKETELRIKRDLASSSLVIKNKARLMEDGLYPSKYKLPISMQFELTSRCNLFCKHCYNRSGVNKNIDKVTPDIWVSFCKELVSYGGIYQATISGGEPLLLGNKLWDIMDILHEDGTNFNLITNGYLFTKKVLEHFLKYRFYWVQVSIDNITSEKHDSFRGVNGSWEKAIRAAYMIALSGIPLRVASTITPSDLENLEDYVKMCINLGATYFIIGEVIPSGRAIDNSEIFLSKTDRDYFYKEMDILTKKYKNQLSILVSGSQRVQLEYASHGAIDGAIVRPDGNIRLDCGCPFVIGNILKDDIADIWSKKSDCWQHPKVKEYIQSCDFITSESTLISNYNDEDIFI